MFNKAYEAFNVLLSTRNHLHYTFEAFSLFKALYDADRALLAADFFFLFTLDLLCGSLIKRE